MTKIESITEDFKNAVDRFDDVLKQEKNEFIRDSTINRFEICFDLCWKNIKTFLEEYNNVICISPKKCFREAFKQELIEYDNFWIELADTRNKTTHIYNEKMAENVYKILPKALEYFKKILKAMKENLNSNDK